MFERTYFSKYDPEHLTAMIRFRVDTLDLGLNQAEHGYLSRLKLAIADGEYAAADSPEALRLAHDAHTLRTIAADLEHACSALIQNAMPRLRLIAAE